MTKIAILCGGEGKRIRPLTELIPKPLIPVLGKPILDHILESYTNQDCRDFIFCVGYKGEKIKEHLKGRTEFKYTISDQGERASMLERIHALRDQFEDDLFVGYGDTFSDLRVQEIIDAHRKAKKWVTILTAKIRSPYGLVKFDETGTPLSFQEKPVLNYYIGNFVISKKAFDSVSKNMLEMKDGAGLVSLFKHLIESKQLNAFEHDKTILTFNTQEERADAEERLKHFYSLNEGKTDES